MSEEKNIEKNTGDKHSDPTSQQSLIGNEHNPATSNQESETITQIQPESQTTNMEVHKHPHHVTHKKKWGEYFLEFLMIFLAVFLGFVAENIREHSVERKKARQYASTMIEDLKADIEALNEGINTNQLILEKLTTLLSIYRTGNSQPGMKGKFYYYGRYGFRFWYYVNKQVTLEQMKQSGTITYFKNSRLENKMVELDKLISFIKYRDDREALFNEQAIRYATSLFNYSVLETIPEENPSLQAFLQSDPPLADPQPLLMIQYLNFCKLRLDMLKQKISTYQSALPEIENLMNELKREFHFI
jgi:hypothetical protein